MLPSLKKKSEANLTRVPSWHPNFRNFQRLPDTKVVRTAFFINVVAITVTLVLLLYVGRGEWELRALKAQISEKDDQIARDKPRSDQAIEVFKRYQLEEAKVMEVENFLTSKPAVSELLMHIGQTLPKDIALDKFELREAGLTLGATIRGSPDVASGLATAYIEQLRVDKKLAQFDDVKTNNSDRNPVTGRITIELFLRLKGGPGAKKP